MIIVDTSVWQYLGILLYILGSSSIFKMSVKIFESNKKNISKNIVKLNLEQNIDLGCIIILSTYVQRKQVFENFMIGLPDKTENSLWPSSQLRVIIESVWQTVTSLIHIWEQIQSVTKKYLRITLVFMWNMALLQTFNLCFSKVFARINKIFTLVGRLHTRVSFYEV